MKNTIQLLSSFCAAIILFGSGCGTLKDADTKTLQGRWQGREVGKEEKGLATISFTGNNVEFRGADPKEWYKGTFTLNEDAEPKQMVASIAECPFPEFVGKSCNVIYQIENGTLTLAGNAPGNPAVPASFDAQGARQFVFLKAPQ